MGVNMERSLKYTINLFLKAKCRTVYLKREKTTLLPVNFLSRKSTGNFKKALMGKRRELSYLAVGL